VTAYNERNEDDVNDDDTVYNRNTATSSFLPESKNESLEIDAIHKSLGSCKINWPSMYNLHVRLNFNLSKEKGIKHHR
jgi:hypothetical protein